MDADLRKLNIAEAREKLADIVNDVAESGQRMVLMRRGRQMVAIVPMADLDTLQAPDMPKVTEVTQNREMRAFTIPHSSQTKVIVFGGVGQKI